MAQSPPDWVETDPAPCGAPEALLAGLLVPVEAVVAAPKLRPRHPYSWPLGPKDSSAARAFVRYQKPRDSAAVQHFEVKVRS